MKHLTDEALMLAVRNGDLEHLSMLFERYHRRLFAFCYRMTDDPATGQDVVQEVFVRVLKYRKTYRDSGSFESWLFQIARNVCSDFLKKRSAIHSVDELSNAAMIDPGHESRFQQSEEIAILRLALRQLPPEKRELIILARYRGMTYEQLAKVMDADTGTIRVRLHRAIKQLEEIFHKLSSEARHAV
jgi:RNA polymerase sigma factor (sigma-70 family)